MTAPRREAFHVEAVSTHLGIPPDDRMNTATDAARVWVQKRRSCTDPAILWDADVLLGATLFAALLYQSRATPLGMSGYDESALYSPATPDALYRARELVGSDPVIA